MRHTSTRTFLIKISIVVFSLFLFSESHSAAGKSAKMIPSNLPEFSGIIVRGVIQLNWKTTGEIKNDFFNIERSVDGITWEAIGKVNGKGSTSGIQSYEFFDENSIPDLEAELFYRIKQIDFRGDSKYVGPIRIQLMNEKKWDIVFLNCPAVHQLMCNLFVNKNEIISVSIYNLMGQVVSGKSFEVMKGSNLLQFDIESFPEGLYFIKTANKDGKGLVKSFLIGSK